MYWCLKFFMATRTWLRNTQPARWIVASLSALFLVISFPKSHSCRNTQSHFEKWEEDSCLLKTPHVEDSNVVPLGVMILSLWLLGSGCWPICFRPSFGLLPIPSWRSIWLIFISLILWFPLGLRPILRIPGIVVPTHGFGTTLRNSRFRSFETEEIEKIDTWNMEEYVRMHAETRQYTYKYYPYTISWRYNIRRPWQVKM